MFNPQGWVTGRAQVSSVLSAYFSLCCQLCVFFGDYISLEFCFCRAQLAVCMAGSAGGHDSPSTFQPFRKTSWYFRGQNLGTWGWARSLAFTVPAPSCRAHRAMIQRDKIKHRTLWGVFSRLEPQRVSKIQVSFTAMHILPVPPHVPMDLVVHLG